ncbi:MAG: response regulator transcription factor, partial [Pleurocapsa sp.]
KLCQQKLEMRSQINRLESANNVTLAEQISNTLTNVRLILVGTEQPLNISGSYILLKTAEILKTHNCSYCRLTYESDRQYLSAMLSTNSDQRKATFQEIGFAINNLEGKLHTEVLDNNIIQIKLSLPYQQKPKNKIELSHREREVIELLADGMRDREIAKKLIISDRTVKIHINNAVTKLNAKTRIQAVHQAYSQGLLTSTIGQT